MDWKELEQQYDREIKDLIFNDHSTFLQFLHSVIKQIDKKFALYVTTATDGQRIILFFDEDGLNDVARRGGYAEHPYTEEFKDVKPGKSFLWIRPDGRRQLIATNEFLAEIPEHLQKTYDAIVHGS